MQLKLKIVYLLLWNFFRVKRGDSSVKKCVSVMGVNIALLLVKNVFINVREGISELVH